MVAARAGLTRGQTAVATVLSSRLSVLPLRLPGGTSRSGCRGGRELLGKSLEHKMLRPGAVLSWGDWEGGAHSCSPA